MWGVSPCSCAGNRSVSRRHSVAALAVLLKAPSCTAGPVPAVIDMTGVDGAALAVVGDTGTGGVAAGAAATAPCGAGASDLLSILMRASCDHEPFGYFAR